jgi:hypothetical protein
LENLRNDIAHGLKPAQPLRLTAEESLPDLQLALIFATVTTARPDSYAPRSGKAILPRNFKVYPDARAAVRSPVELIYHRPYYGEWLQVERSFSQEKSRVEPDGNYIWGARPRIAVKGKFANDYSGLVREYVIFERTGRTYTNLSTDDDFPWVPVLPWRPTTLSPAWHRYLSVQENESDT